MVRTDLAGGYRGVVILGEGAGGLRNLATPALDAVGDLLLGRSDARRQIVPDPLRRALWGDFGQGTSSGPLRNRTGRLAAADISGRFDLLAPPRRIERPTYPLLGGNTFTL